MEKINKNTNPDSIIEYLSNTSSLENKVDKIINIILKGLLNMIKFSLRTKTRELKVFRAI